VIAVRRTAQFIRHIPGLDRVEWLWTILRKPYHWVLDLGGHGTKVLVGGTAVVWMPAEFTGGAWESFEPESVAAFTQWLRKNPGGMVLDVGSSLGIYTAIALFNNDTVEVVAFDSDLASLAAVRRLCQHATGRRLRLVHGFIAEMTTDATSLEAAVRISYESLLQTGERDDGIRYICLSDVDANTIPRRRLDDLFADNVANECRILIKCGNCWCC
jgi:hypothetical protein